MDPKVINIDEKDSTMTFTLTNTNVSIANAIRRILLSEIPCVVFKTTPYEDSKVTIDINTSKFNNEVIKQRLSCIPIHIGDLDFPINDYMLEINKQNDSDIIDYVTTEDFKIKNIKLDNYLKESTTRTIFPKNDITNQYIDLIRINPKFNESINGEQLKLSCYFSIGTSKEQGMFNVVSTCCYKFTQDPGLINHAWGEKEKELKKTKTKEEIDDAKKDWLSLDAKRLFVKNSFDFIIETLGIYTNFKLVEMACDILIEKLNTVNTLLVNNPTLINETDNTTENSYDITLENEDYTIGKVIEHLLHYKYFSEQGSLLYCGFLKEHPHNNYSIIRVVFKNIVDNTEILTVFADVINIAIDLFKKIKDNFTFE
jgi:DNA-directed RNA polymerase II subunit RPB3